MKFPTLDSKEIGKRPIHIPLIAKITFYSVLILAGVNFGINADSISAKMFLLALILFGLLILFIQYQRVGFYFSAEHLQFQNIKGGWVIKWRNIKKIDLISYQDNASQLPWIGIELKEPEQFLKAISYRVASEMLLSQRGLFILGAKKQNIPEESISERMVESTPYELGDGTEVVGLIAAIAHRMQYQHQAFGSHLFISDSDAILELDEFVGLARQFIARARS